MNKKIFLITALIALSGAVTTVFAQTKLTLKEYQNQVVDYSNSLKIADEKTAASLSKIKASRSGYFPSLDLDAGANYLVGMPKLMGLELKDYTYNATLTLQQNVYAGGAVRNQTKAARIENQLTVLSREATLDNVIYVAQVTYWAFSASYEQLEISREYVRIVNTLFQVVKERFENGYVSRTDLLMVETRLNEAKIQETAAEKLYMSSLQNLNTRLGNDEIESFMAVDALFSIDSIDYSSTLEDALARRPDYLMAKTDVKLQEQLVRLSRSKFNPKFVVGIQGVYGTPTINVSGQGSLYGIAFASLNVPILAWGERRNTVAQAKSSAISAEWSLLDAKDVVNNDLSNSQISLRQSFQEATIAIANLLISQDNLELNTYSYAEGKLPILDVLQAQLSWIQAYTASVSSCYNYHTAVSAYYKALGMIGR